MQPLHADCSKAEPKIFTPPQTPFLGAHDGQNLISWRWSLPLPTNPVWWGSTHTISSYHCNRPTQTQTHTHPATNRQDRLQYTASQLARYMASMANMIWGQLGRLAMLQPFFWPVISCMSGTIVSLMTTLHQSECSKNVHHQLHFHFPKTGNRQRHMNIPWILFLLPCAPVSLSRGYKNRIHYTQFAKQYPLSPYLVLKIQIL